MNPQLYELLNALERHTQAMQANTAAVNSLLGRKVVGTDPAARYAVARELDALGVKLGEQLGEQARIADALEMLRQSLTITQPPAATGSEASP